MKAPPKTLKKSDNAFPVVGIGASAGGLDAFKKLLNAISEDSGMAYVLVQHLDPTHESMLQELLQKVTAIPVLEVTDAIKVVPDHIYIIPSNRIMIANDGVLELSPRPAKSETERHMPIDLFFTSLAEVHQSFSIGVVLSGTATDGTLGLKAIKDHGGITFAQDKGSAAYGGMPQSAVQAGVVDFVLPPGEIPKKLLEVAYITNGNGAENSGQQEEDAIFKQIISLLRVRKGTDFTYYKQTTIRRRILRRTAITKTKKPSAYLNYLRRDKHEQDVLYMDLLIPVTEFFRDSEIFDRLHKKVIPAIIANKTSGGTIRVWVAGCSTGEEAYSLAIAFHELLVGKDASAPPQKVQVFATDLSGPAIEKARSGMYSKSEVKGLAPDRLQRYFTKSNGGYQVNKAIRNSCVFAVHDFLKDPPFSRMDLISCRNVLIYLGVYLQKRALTTFHYALNPKGILWLGKSETTNGVPAHFTTVDNKDKLFSRKEAPGHLIPITGQRSEQSFTDLGGIGKTGNIQTDFQKTADDILLNRFTPAGVVINEAMDIVHFRGSTGRYLEPAPGKASLNILRMAKDGLAFELRSILHKAKKNNEAVVKNNIPIRTTGTEERSISIEAIPLPNIVEPHYLILFHERDLKEGTKSTTGKKRIKELDSDGKTKKDKKDLRIQQLEQELAQTREDMRSITEDQDAANEELQSANEELLSSSEELQSLNEELETGKEELQSTNEELMVVHQEMQGLNEQLIASRDFAEGIVGTVHEPLVVLDRNFRVISANNAFYKTFEVNEKDTEGKLIFQLGNKQWDIPDLQTLLIDVLPHRSTIENFEVAWNFPNIGERTMLLNAREIKTDTKDEKLILLAIEDITEQIKVRKQKLETYKKHADELEEQVVLRTVELKAANDELLVSNDELKRLNKELEAFTYVASHDLQEPLRKIQTFVRRISNGEDQGLTDKGKGYFQRVFAVSEQMSGLIKDLLNFSRLGSSERKFVKTDLGKLTGDIIAEFEEIIVEKKAMITCTEMDTVKVIPFQFRQLMYNLIGNALKFSRPDNPPHITIKSKIAKGNKLENKGLLPDKKYCQITVEDNGIGFKPEYSDQIFEVFKRLHGKDAYPGTGIGLATVKRIAENHNGTITVDGALGRGARFDIYIPVFQEISRSPSHSVPDILHQ